MDAVMPEWALAVGMPDPDGEEFEAYCARLGLDPAQFTDGLTETTMELANLRLAHSLRNVPALDRVFREHCRQRRQAALDALYRDPR